MRTTPGLLFCAIVTIVTLTGCTRFQEPLSTRSESFLDERLVGTWRLKDEEEDPCVVTVTANKDTNEFTIMEHEPLEEQVRERSETRRSRRGRALEAEGSRDTVVGRATRIGEATFLSVTVDDEWGVVKYAFELPHVVHFFYVREDKLLDAVMSGELAGTFRIPKPCLLDVLLGIKPGPELGEVTASSEDLRQFVEKHHATLFDESPLMTFVRMKNNERVDGLAARQSDP